MYKRITEEDQEHLKSLGYIKMTKSLNENNRGGLIKFVNIDNPDNFKELFRFNFVNNKNGLIFLNFKPARPMPHVREYEKFLIPCLDYMISIAEEFSFPSLFVQSSDPRILEGYYETRFNKIRISDISKTERVYSATKKFTIK